MSRTELMPRSDVGGMSEQHGQKRIARHVLYQQLDTIPYLSPDVFYVINWVSDHSNEA